MEKVRKAIVPLAGLNLRMLPASKVIPKEMFPVAGKPIIQYIVNEIEMAGFKEIIFITRPNDFFIQNYFDKKLNLNLAKGIRAKRIIIEDTNKTTKLHLSHKTVNQLSPKGLGHAVLTAKEVVDGEPFAVVLPDMLLKNSSKEKNLTLMKKFFDKKNISSILFSEAEKKDLPNYGVAKFKKDSKFSSLGEIESIIEKPTIKKAPSNLFISGRYVFSNEIFQYLEKTVPDKNKEIQLTDAINLYLAEKKIYGFRTNGKIYDCGDKLGYIIANLEYSIEDKQISKSLKYYLKKNV
tara:strand:+ start:518 stop:1396 length:879 start_codon:yes stop_codon:yes gene_type:complete